ncbi:MAG: ABC transporter ATP-binding protein [Mycobacteriales bacterium]|nr:ABC transporter ATP-binding protein [Mycobacteriales bacterium]
MSRAATLPTPRTGREGAEGQPALELRGVSAGYGRVQVLHEVDLVVPARGVVALLGPNGAGKTTLLRVASGRTVASSGTVLVRGKAVQGPQVRTSPERLARAGLCSVPEGRGVFPNLTVAENLRMWTHRPGVRRADVEEQAYVRFPRLRERRRQLAGTLSGGEQQMLAMSRALTTGPDVLLLDEISMGLAPVVVAELFALVAQVAQEGTPVLLVEQFARTALEVADTAVVLAGGRVRAAGTPDEVRDLVDDAYLASSSGAPSGAPAPQNVPHVPSVPHVPLPR